MNIEAILNAARRDEELTEPDLDPTRLRLWRRSEEAWRLKQAGASFGEVGRELGISLWLAKHDVRAAAVRRGLAERKDRRRVEVWEVPQECSGRENTPFSALGGGSGPPTPDNAP